MQNRKFTGIFIPADIWLDERINALDKIILMEIDSLDVDNKGCKATNEIIGKFCQCSPTKISYSIQKLIDLGYIAIIKFDGKNRILKTTIWDAYKFCKHQEICLQNLKASDYNIYNIYNNNINKENKKENIDISKDISIKEKRKEYSFKKPTLEDVKNYCKIRENKVNPKKFYDYYETSEWRDSNGKQIKNWKQKIILWEKDDTFTKEIKLKENIQPEWLDKEYEEDTATEEEIQELEKRLKS